VLIEPNLRTPFIRLNLGDADANPLSAANRYVLHFAKNEIAPVGAFWSATLYDKDGFPTANVLTIARGTGNSP
jgi:hypothetical protein